MTHDGIPVWPARYLRVSAALLLAGALLVWVTPVNVPGTNLVPFGCGSPADPVGGDLARFVCKRSLADIKTLALVLLLAAGALLLMSEVVTPRWGGEKWLLGLALTAPVALPLLAWSLASLFLVVGAVAADGSLIRCGTAIAPATDSISVGLCGQLTDRRLSLGLGGALLGAGAVAGAVYVSSALTERDPHIAQTDGLDRTRPGDVT